MTLRHEFIRLNQSFFASPNRLSFEIHAKAISEISLLVIFFL